MAYDRLIRRFQTHAEREAEGRKKGYTGVLEADLWRSEAKLEALANPDNAANMRYRRDANGEIVEEERDEIPSSKEEGLQRWNKEMELRFLRGDDADFDYKIVDENEEYDDLTGQERDEQDRYFEDEEPQWTLSTQDNEGEGGRNEELVGQTGIQDF